MTRKRILLIFFLLAFASNSCAPVATPTPAAETTAPSTFTPMPHTPTITPIPTSENIADVQDLSVWVDEFSHAYGGKVMVNSVELDAEQLIAEIGNNSKEFIQHKNIDGMEYLFLVVNGVPLAKSKADVWQWKKTSIADLADNLKLQFGSQIVHYELSNTAYSDIALNEFNMYLTNGELDYSLRWINEDQFDYSAADEFFAFTDQTGKPIHMYHLLDGENIPDWLQNSTYLRERYAEIMQGRIRSMMEKYQGRIELYSVVNETFDWNRYKGFWFEKIGGDYIEIAFRTARESDPNAILIYNDVNVSNGAIDDHEDAVFKLVNSLKEKDLLDGVGMQMHINASQMFDKEGFLQNLLRYKQNGITVYITEFDVNISQTQGSEKQRQEIKARIFQDALSAYLESGPGSSFCLFGFSSAVSWIPAADAHIFDGNFQPQPAYYSTLQVLYEQLP